VDPPFVMTEENHSGPQRLKFPGGSRKRTAEKARSEITRSTLDRPRSQRPQEGSPVLLVVFDAHAKYYLEAFFYLSFQASAL